MLAAALSIAGWYVAPVGLFILAGHSEVGLRGMTLYAVECCGPLRWKWERSTADLRRFFESDLRWLRRYGFSPLAPVGLHEGLNPQGAA